MANQIIIKILDKTQKNKHRLIQILMQKKTCMQYVTVIARFEERNVPNVELSANYSLALKEMYVFNHRDVDR